jgi:hypothetical protein
MGTHSVAAYAEYGSLANRYLFGFEDKWIEGTPETSKLLGAADFQSLADLGNSYDMVREMRIVPFGLENVTRLAIATATPFLPLVLTIFRSDKSRTFSSKSLSDNVCSSCETCQLWRCGQARSFQGRVVVSGMEVPQTLRNFLLRVDQRDFDLKCICHGLE